MVEATNPQKNLDVKLSLDLSAKGMSPIVKRVIATNYETLMGQATKLASRHNISESDVSLRYHDGDSWVIVEDNDDLELAFAIALSNSSKLTFSIKPTQVASSEVSAFAAAANADEEMKEESATGHKKKEKKEKGLPRKALKNLINNELNKQA